MSEGLYKALQKNHRACMLSLEEDAKIRRAESIKETSKMREGEVYISVGKNFIAVSPHEATEVLKAVDKYNHSSAKMSSDCSPSL